MGDTFTPKPETDPDLTDEAPTGPELTDDDKRLFIIYALILDAEQQGCSWCEIAKDILKINPDEEPERARQRYANHHNRAHWMVTDGWKFLGDDPEAAKQAWEQATVERH